MKSIITLLLLVFSASVLDARSVKLVFTFNFDSEVLTITTTDSKTKDQKTQKILLDNENISVSKNKDGLQKISNYLNEVQKGDGFPKRIYPWDEKDVISAFDIINHYETSFIWSNYQVFRQRFYDKELRIFSLYFYKPD